MPKNWKTTLTGIIGGIIPVAISLLQNGTVDPKTVGISLGIAALGVVSKDFNVTGGTVQQNTTEPSDK